MTALRCVIDMTIRLGDAKCKGALSYRGRLGSRFGRRARRRGARRPVSLFSRGPRHSRASGNLLETALPAKAGIYPFARLWIRDSRLRGNDGHGRRCAAGATMDTRFPPSRE